MILCFTGWARSGKDAAARYAAQKYGLDEFVFADYIVKEIKRRGLKDTKPNRTKIAGEMRKEHGMHAVAIPLAEDFLRKKPKNAVLVGPRSPQEVKFLFEKIGRFPVIEVYASQEIRFARRSKIDPAEREEFFKRDKIDDKKYGLGKLIAMAEYRISNEGTLEELYKNVDLLITGLKREKR